MKIKISRRFKKKLLEAFRSILPVTVIVLLLAFLYVPMSPGTLIEFVIGSALLILGMALFTLGADVAMTPMGHLLGSFIARRNKLWFLALMGIVLGVIITVTEPGLQVLAELAAGIPTMTLIITVAAGVGVFLAIAFLREVLHLSFRYILLVFYLFLFIFSFFVPETFLPIAFDSGGATTGSMTVPFIMALGVGIAFTQKGSSSKRDDSFGLVAICSIGPILAVMILGMLYTPDGSAGDYTVYISDGVYDIASLWSIYTTALLQYMWETLLLLAPIVACFVIIRFTALKMSKGTMVRIFKGLFYTFAGLVLFLTGANVGFLPVGSIIGQSLAGADFSWILVIGGMVFGYFIIAAEPAVSILNKQVFEITRGAVSIRAMKLSLSIGVALAVGLSMLRVLTGLPVVWILLPGYILSVGLSFVVPKIFTSIAFDAGGVASGPLSSAFLLPMAIGASGALGGNIVTDAFGLIAMVAMTPLITIQVTGLYVMLKAKRAK